MQFSLLVTNHDHEQSRGRILFSSPTLRSWKHEKICQNEKKYQNMGESYKKECRKWWTIVLTVELLIGAKRCISVKKDKVGGIWYKHCIMNSIPLLELDHFESESPYWSMLNRDFSPFLFHKMSKSGNGPPPPSPRPSPMIIIFWHDPFLMKNHNRYKIRSLLCDWPSHNFGCKDFTEHHYICIIFISALSLWNLSHYY